MQMWYMWADFIIIQVCDGGQLCVNLVRVYSHGEGQNRLAKGIWWLGAEEVSVCPSVLRTSGRRAIKECTVRV
jgi:hypothetical protein